MEWVLDNVFLLFIAIATAGVIFQGMFDRQEDLEIYTFSGTDLETFRKQGRRFNTVEGVFCKWCKRARKLKLKAYRQGIDLGFQFESKNQSAFKAEDR